jgi:hypothetical protein
VAETLTAGTEFARAFAEKDFRRVHELLDPEVDFRGLTPSRSWEASGPHAVVEDVLKLWLEPDDEVEAIESIETDSFADRERVGYRFRVSNPSGRFVVEQQAYLTQVEGRIAWMRVVCSGFRPVAGEP